MAIVTRAGSLYIWRRGFTIAGPTAGSFSQAGGVLLVPLLGPVPLGCLTPMPHSGNATASLALCSSHRVRSTFLLRGLCSSNRQYPGMLPWGTPRYLEAREGAGGGAEWGLGKSNTVKQRRCQWELGRPTSHPDDPT